MREKRGKGEGRGKKRGRGRGSARTRVRAREYTRNTGGGKICARKKKLRTHTCTHTHTHTHKSLTMKRGADNTRRRTVWHSGSPGWCRVLPLVGGRCVRGCPKVPLHLFEHLVKTCKKSTAQRVPGIGQINWRAVVQANRTKKMRGHAGKIIVQKSRYRRRVSGVGVGVHGQLTQGAN